MTDMVVRLIRFLLLVAGIAVLVLLGLAAWTGAPWAEYGPLMAALVGLACGALLLQISDRLRDMAEAQAETNALLLARGREPAKEQGRAAGDAAPRTEAKPALRAEPKAALRGATKAEPRGEDRGSASRREPVLQRKD